MGNNVVTLVDSDEAILEYSIDGGNTWYEIPFIGSIDAADNPGAVNEVRALNGVAQSTQISPPQVLSVTLASSLGTSKASQDLNDYSCLLYTSPSPRDS